VHYKLSTEQSSSLSSYAISSWTGFSNATDQQKIQDFINRSKNAGFCNTELDDFALLFVPRLT